MSPDLWQELRNRRIVILGFGREGRSTWRWLRRRVPDLPLTVADRNPCEAGAESDAATTLRCGPDYLEEIRDGDLLIRTPGIPLRDIPVPPGARVTSQTDLFLRHAPCRTVGVTGTKGKSTTATLIHGMLTEAGRDACLMGNIGVPVLDRLDDLTEEQVAVIELSSHQLEGVSASPDIAVLTNLYPDHLDHYDSYDHYVSAKMNILRFQSADGICVYNADHTELSRKVAELARGRAVPVSLPDAVREGFPPDLGVVNPALAGQHNRMDALLAAAAAKELGADTDAVLRALSRFSGMPHRMEPVATVNGVRFVDNAIATIPESTLHAIATLSNVETLLVGGMDRGLDYRSFAEKLARTGIRHVICMPDTGAAIARLLTRTSGITCHMADDMEQAVTTAVTVTRPGRTCLLSPTAASYNRYRDFEEKGNEFRRQVLRHAAPKERGTP